MSTRQSTAGHPTALFVLSSPAYKDYNGKDKVALWYFETAREAAWAVLDGNGQGSEHSQEWNPGIEVFGRLTLLHDGPTIDLTPVVDRAYMEQIRELQRAGLTREWAPTTVPMARTVEGPDKRVFNSIRKAAVASLEQAILAALPSQQG